MWMCSQLLNRTYQAVAALDSPSGDQRQCGRVPEQFTRFNQCLVFFSSGGVSSVMRTSLLLLIPLLRFSESLPIGRNAVAEDVLM